MTPPPRSSAIFFANLFSLSFSGIQGEASSPIKAAESNVQLELSRLIIRTERNTASLLFNPTLPALLKELHPRISALLQFRLKINNAQVYINIYIFLNNHGHGESL